MNYIYEVCDRSLIETLSEYQHYLDTSDKKNDNSLYIKYTINNINLDEIDKTLNDCITTHKEKFSFYLINCKLAIEFGDNVIENKETEYFYNTDIISIKRDLLFNFYQFIPRVYKACNVCNIKQMILKTINDRCNITYNYYKNSPISMVERRINFIIAKNPSLINKPNRNKNHPQLGKYSLIPFNN